MPGFRPAIMDRLVVSTRLAAMLGLTLATHGESTVVFNEVHYHPPTAEADQEWIEFHNPMAVNVDLSNWAMLGGVEYRFPEGTVIPGGGFLVVAHNPAALRSSTGLTNVLGPFQGRLSNDGELLELRNNNARLMDALEYGTEDPWPVAPDDAGVTLAKRAPLRPSSLAESWTASAQMGGTPGAANFPRTQEVTPATVLGFGSRWRYADPGTAPGAEWASATFDDAAWIAAPTPIFGGFAVAPDGELRPIPGVFNTGLDETGRALAPGTRDPHYVVTASAESVAPPPPSPALVISGHPAWIANDGLSAWLGPVNPGTTAVAAGPYRLRTGFDLSGFDPATAALQLTVAADNRLNEVVLNSRRLGLAWEGFNSFGPEWKLTNGFLPGTNVLEFWWANDSSSPNPAGFRAKLQGTARTFSPPESRLPRIASATYLRTTFVFAGPANATALKLRCRLDDGAAFYLNGVEAGRWNLPAGTLSPATPATTNATNTPQLIELELPRGLLVAGTNVLAAELHQSTNGLDDAWFEAEVIATPLPPDEPSPVVFNELGVPGPEFFIEVANRSAASLALSGYEVVRLGAVGGRWVFPPGTTLAAAAQQSISAATLGFQPAAGERLVLLPPGAASVADAVVVKDQARARFPDATGEWRLPDQLTPGNSNHFNFHSEIVINEIFYHAHPAHPAAGWVELFHRGTEPTDLSTWRLSDGVRFRFPLGTKLSPGEFLVVAEDPDSFRTEYPGVRVIGPYSGALSRGGERVRLKDVFGNPADEVRYFDGGRWPERADGGGSSLELRHPGADNAVAENWAASQEGSRAVWRSYSYTATAVSAPGPTQWREWVVGLLDTGECLLDDMQVTESPDGTSVSLLANGDFENGAATWRFLGTHRRSRVIPDPDNPANHVLHLVATGPTEHMHNHLETTLVNNRAVVNGRTYRVSFRAKWLGGDNHLNTRLYFNRVGRTTELEVPISPGTPGAPNSTRTTALGPAFADLTHTPVLPAPNQPTDIQVTASDPDGVSQATLRWSVNGGAWQSQAMSAGREGTYVGRIPGAAVGALVQFYVEATDGGGATAMFPAEGPNSRALYVVGDGSATSSALHQLRLLMTAADRTLLYATTNLMSNEPLKATVLYDDEVFYDATVHLQGSQRGRPDPSRVGFTIGFPPDHLFRGVHATISVDRSGGYTGVGGDQDEIVLKHVVQHAGGVAGMYDDLVEFIAPRPEHSGTALLLLAKYGDVFLDSQYPDGSDGRLFKHELVYWPTRTTDGNPQSPKVPSPDEVQGVDLTDLGDDPEVYRWYFLMENQRRRNDYAPLIALAKSMRLTGAALATESERLMDVDQWMRVVAFQTLFGMVDTYPFDNPHNFMIYFRPEDGRALPFLWDMDFDFGASPSAPIHRATGNLARLMALPANERRFQGHLLDILTTTYNRRYLAPWIEHYGDLAGQNFRGILNYVDARETSVRSQLLPRVDFSLTAANADGLVENGTLAVSGNAWINVRDVRLRGVETPLPWTWSTTTHWQASVPLVLGLNHLELVAYDFQGVALVTNVVEATSTLTGSVTDADGDGLPDLWELIEGLDPTRADGAEDPDGDGLTNREEYQSGTHPRDATSRMELTALRTEAGVQLEFVARAGRSYTLLARPADESGPWRSVQDIGPAMADRPIRWAVPAAPANSGMLYRLAIPRAR